MDLSRTEALIGAHGAAALKDVAVMIAGLGGVGGYAAEALQRSGIGRLILIDGDIVCESNLNRQIFATCKTVGMKKSDAAKARLLEINPDSDITALDFFITRENVWELFAFNPDFVIDAVDNISAKLALASVCQSVGIGFVSSMGAGNRTDPTSFRRGRLADTTGFGCGLARAMRREAKKRGLENIRVVYSVQPPAQTAPVTQEATKSGRRPPASAGWTVGAAGLALAAECVDYFLCKAYKNY